MPSRASLAAEFFGSEQVERARRYHGIHYVAFGLNAAVALAVLAVLALAGPSFDELAWWVAATVTASLVVICLFLARFPVGYLLGHRRERAWGFSTQETAGWLADRAKGLAVALLLTVPPLVGLVALARWFPSWWPVPAAIGAAAIVLLVGFVAPVVIEPLFNRFAPLADEELRRQLRELAERAGTPVRDVLVADASRRTRKVNAYVSGLGRTRRVVLFDTLLERSPPSEIALVVAHELGHRRARHVLKLTLVGMVGTAVFVLLLWAFLRWDLLLDALGASGPGDPRILPFVLLLGTILEYLSLPAAAALSRRYEREADAISLDLTQDPRVFEQTHRDLAVANLSDLDPPRGVYVLLFSHPTPPERIAFGRRWSGATA